MIWWSPDKIDDLVPPVSLSTSDVIGDAFGKICHR
jgi:hypothetical protein